jgi:hypothetical protein
MKTTFAFASILALTVACDGGDGDTSESTAPMTSEQTDPGTTSVPTTTSDDTTTTSDDTTTTSDDTTTTSDDTTTEMTTAGALSFEADVWTPIMLPKCGCHQSMIGSGGLAMGTDAATAYAAMVDVPSTTGVNYVTPGDSANSYVHAKITGSQGKGSQMPLGDSLTPEQIDIMTAWMDGGALP